MPNFNKVILAGHLTRDPDLAYSKSNKPFCKFGLAVSKKYAGKESTCFIDCTAFGKTAESINEHHSKGDAIMVEGELSFDQWESKDGQKRSRHTVIVLSFTFLKSEYGRRRKVESGERISKPSGNKSLYENAVEAKDDNDIPF